MAKCHIASTDGNYQSIRFHLGGCHYATGIFTTAFINLSKEYKELKWMKD